MTEKDASAEYCRKCGALLDASILGGSCSACMWAEMLGDEEQAQSSYQHSPVIEGYEVYEEIGQGGMGVVYRARQHQPMREVALKIVAPYSLRVVEARKRFLMEVEAMAAIEHPAVLPLYQSGEDAYGRPWLTMQLVGGGSLAEHAGRYAGQWKKIAMLLRTLCAAIAYAHERGVLHRDLKPANILFDEEENPYIADFGLAKWANNDSGITQASYLLGSPAYLAPEAAEGGSSATTTVSDVYGLGAILYELLTQKRPYEGANPGEILTQIIHADPPAPRKITAKLPRDLEVIVMKAMARTPTQRYHSAAAMAEDLERWMEGKAILARPMGALEKIWSWARRNPALAALSVLLSISIITGGVLQWRANKKLTLALDDVEDRVDFMVRELPARIAPLGRLELLDDVFENVAEHYAREDRTDDESLARHADFYAQWAYIRRTQGMSDEAYNHLRSSYHLAQQACKGDALSLSLVTSRISAGWRLGEILIEKEEYAETAKVMEDTRAFAARYKPKYGQEFEFQHLEAALTTEIMILHTRNNQLPQALAESEKARVLWNTLAASWEKSSQSASENSARREAIIFLFHLSQIHQRSDNQDEEEKVLNEFVTASQALQNADEGNLNFATLYFNALLNQARFHIDTGRGDGEAIMANLISVDQKSRVIYAQEPGNIDWLSNSVYIARALVKLASKKGDEAAVGQWLDIMNERLLIFYDVKTTDIASLAAKRDAGVYCYENHDDKPWDWLKRHFLAVLKTQMEICSLSNNPRGFHNLRNIQNRYVRYLKANEGVPAAVTWLKDRTVLLDQKITDASSTEKREMWTLMQAYTKQLLADAGESAFWPMAAELFLSSLHAAEKVIANELKDLDELDVRKATDLLQILIAAGGDKSITRSTETDEKLAALIIKVVPQFPTTNQTEIIALIEKTFRGADGKYCPAYQTLETLKATENK